VQLLLEKKSADVPKILDVGSGVGKFCLIAALASEVASSVLNSAADSSS